jgi:hypothetical protein
MKLLLLAICLITTRTYWAIDPTVFPVSGSVHTHVWVTGYVKYVACEADGDLHVRVTSSPNITSPFFIAECIPSLPCSRPPIGSHVMVQGLSRFDPEHHWWEIHPVEKLEVIQ